MLLTISDSDEFCRQLKSEYDRLGIFSFFLRTDNFTNFVDSDTNIIDTVIIDASLPQDESKRICRSMKESKSILKIGVILKSSKSASARFLQLKDADAELFLPFTHDQFLSFYKRLCPLEKECTKNPRLAISPDRLKTYLIGYKLDLTKTEHKILLLLSANPDRSFSASDISRLISPLSIKLMSANNVAVHVSANNKKAYLITGRMLILNSHKEGYRLSQEI